jgi:hypothetical protein
MVTRGWRMLGVVALVVCPRPVLAGDPPTAATRPVLGANPAGGDETVKMPVLPPPEPLTARGSCAPFPARGCHVHRGGCGQCGESKLHRLCSWLFYVPLDRGCKGICCNGTIGPYPPLYAYFPCQAAACSGCAACAGAPGKTLYFAKQPGADMSGPVAQADHGGGEAQSSGAQAAPPKRMSTYKPGAIATSMPVLPPDQFKKRPAPNACAPGTH